MSLLSTVARSNKSVEQSLKSDTAVMNKTICFSSEKTERKSERDRASERVINLLISPKKKEKKPSCEFKLDDHSF